MVHGPLMGQPCTVTEFLSEYQRAFNAQQAALDSNCLQFARVLVADCGYLLLLPVSWTLAHGLEVCFLEHLQKRWELFHGVESPLREFDVARTGHAQRTPRMEVV